MPKPRIAWYDEYGGGDLISQCVVTSESDKSQRHRRKEALFFSEMNQIYVHMWTDVSRASHGRSVWLKVPCGSDLG